MFASLPELKAHLNITRDADDGELSLMLDAAEDVVAGIIGRAPTGVVTEQVTAPAGTAILRHRGVSAVTVDGTPATWVDGPAGLVHGLTYGPHTITYTVDGSVPSAVTLATLIVAAHLWETQRGTSPSALALQGDVDPTATAGRGFAVPNRARELLAPYTSAAQLA